LAGIICWSSIEDLGEGKGKNPEKKEEKEGDEHCLHAVRGVGRYSGKKKIG